MSPPRRLGFLLRYQRLAMVRKSGMRFGSRLWSGSATSVIERIPLIHTWAHTRHLKVSAKLWRAVMLAGTVCGALLIALPLRYAVQEETRLLRYRALMESLTGTVRTMRSRAMAEQQIVELRIDASQGVFQLAVVQQGKRPYEALEQTLWLPEGLQISDAPSVVSAFPTGQLSEAVIVVTAPSYHRRFRLMISQLGMVRLFEETML